MNPLAHLLSRESRARLPDPQDILDVGYTHHAADDPALEGTNAREIARELVRRFMAIEAKSDIEKAYLACAQGIAFAFGRAIARRKQKYAQDRSAATAERTRQLNLIQESQKQGVYLNAAYRAVAPALMLLSGYMVSSLIGLFIPADVTGQVGRKLPGIILGLAFALIGRAISQWMSNRRREQIETQYYRAISLADEVYELGKLAEYRQYRQRLCEAWEAYTGEKYPDQASYELVMLGDTATRIQSERERQNADRSLLWVLKRIIRILQLGRRNRVGNKGKSESAQILQPQTTEPQTQEE